LNRAVIVAVFGEGLRRHNVFSFPVRQFFFQFGLQICKNVIFRARRAVASFPFGPARFSRLSHSVYAFFVDHGIKLLAHASLLGNGFNLISVNYATTVREGTSGPAASNRTVRLFFCFVDNFKAAHPLGFFCRSMRHKANSCAVWGKPPVG